MNFNKNEENLTKKKSIVIYFSHTGENWMADGLQNIEKRNTEIVAEKIQKLVNADIFEVQPKNAYPHGYYECCDVAKKELNQNARPELIKYLDNIDNYETIYIGSPIWWGHIAMPLFTQLEKLNFKGKIVKLFIAHEGSGLGNCPQDIEKLCKGAEIRKSLAIRGCTAQNSDNELEKWIK